MLKRIFNNTPLNLTIVLATAIITFFPTLKMYFFMDEWGNLYEWTHGYQYRYSVFPGEVFHFLFETFGLNATGYYATGLVGYALSVVIFYLLVSRTLKSKLLGLIAGLVYATCPIGINTVQMVWTYVAEGGYPLTIALLILLYLMVGYFQEKKIYYFILVSVCFLLFLELEPRRVFLFLPLLFLFDYFYNFKKIIPNVGFFLRQAILLFIFVAYYRYNVTLSNIILHSGVVFLSGASTFDWQTKANFSKVALASPQPLISLTNILLAGPWIFISERLKGHVDLVDIKQVYQVVIATLSLAGLIVVLALKTKKQWGLLLLFSLGWIYANILGFYIFSSPGVNDAPHRYLSLAAPGYALFVTLSIASLYAFFAKRNKKAKPKLKKVFVAILLGIIVVNFLSVKTNFDKFNDFHGKPARAFYKSLKEYYPTLPPDSILYFQTPPSPAVKYKLSRIYGGSNYGVPATIAVFYPERKKEELVWATDLVKVEEFIKSDKTRIDRVFAFYYDDNGLWDKTEEVRKKLMANSS
ncbi:MAG: hypothetical protein A2782_03325 [Candidatus Blackburnbacteria bacterium RIFCSPHIGHO2_01_FULL_43_15b]|uniref:Glycosyltransferase RgtA/B/C/D-like domain-containing protein n=1 Tax=Candidatus Blackburnbacteria bacterium RIFCSPHIGHO2_01_FULL_43_15b TaxID=1797513 RepID=A0A1G1V2E0_9BACT|nr:MAG: hypothetical protein A2782_03325 [Candidatus Blackburnbacteria bacterium RIFCSPHIGHO2_01_FULL_43_15b]